GVRPGRFDTARWALRCATTSLALHPPARGDRRVPARHTALALLVAVLWGLNFLAIHASLEQFPPLFLVGFRFLVLVPAVLFVPWPRVPVRWLVGYGLGTPRRALGVGTAVLGLGVVGLAQGRAES